MGKVGVWGRFTRRREKSGVRLESVHEMNKGGKIEDLVLMFRET